MNTSDVQRRVWRSAGEISEQVGVAGERQTYLDATQELLNRVIGGDLSGYTYMDFEERHARMWGLSEASGVSDRLGTVLDDHPLILSYRAESQRLAAGSGAGRPAAPMPTPRRMSDVIAQREFERGRTFAEIYQPIGSRFTLTIVTEPDWSRTGGGWALNRDRRDFTDADVEMARVLQPTLALLEAAYGLAAAGELAGRHAGARTGDAVPGMQLADAKEDALGGATSDAAGDAAERLALTARELEVLRLLARGLTAQHIGHLLRISPRTVGKHLEHLYAKLGCHDRLLAVTHARAAGLLDGVSAVGGSAPTAPEASVGS